MARIIIKQELPPDNPPHPKDSPILIHRSIDYGWIVEKVFEGEYEVQDFRFNNEPDIELAERISNGAEIWICPSN